jgi:hypothetical protein
MGLVKAMNNIIGRKNTATISSSSSDKPHSGESSEWGRQLLLARISAVRERNAAAAASIDAMAEYAAICVQTGELAAAKINVLAAELAVTDESKLENLRQLIRCETGYFTY